ncbi:MAG: hypothetical protein KC486_21480 [Myxococcales bacterium]|nr:hypothetical protein [Myxococcales bacterium]
MSAPLRRDFPTGAPRRERDDDRERVTVAVEVPADMLYFSGHFPGYPILPGVAQLVPLVVGQIRGAWADLERPRRLSRLKFRQPIFPGAQLELQLERRGDAARVQFRLLRDGRTCSEGAVDYTPAAA